MNIETAVEQMIIFETEGLDDDETIELFQFLVDSGTIRNLQGSYQRMAGNLIKAGYVKTYPQPVDNF